MVRGRTSVIIPARNEPFLQRTIDSLLAKAAGDIEVIPVLDGYWPDPPLRDDPRVLVLHRGEAQGMRPAINSAAEVASGEFLMKCDAHCIFALGFDEALKADCEDNWLAVPTRHSIDPEAWKASTPPSGPPGSSTAADEDAAVRHRHFNYHYLTFPYDQSMYGYGLHAKTLPWKDNQKLNADRAAVPVDDLMSFQGSCWFQTTANFRRLGPLDHANYYFYQEAQEVGLRQWMTGGRCVINKNTWYAHLHKGREQGRGFYLSLRRKRASEAYATDFWMNDRWPGAVRTFADFVSQFWPLPGWPEDWTDPKYREAFLTRPPERIPAHT